MPNVPHASLPALTPKKNFGRSAAGGGEGERRKGRGEEGEGGGEEGKGEEGEARVARARARHTLRG